MPPIVTGSSDNEMNSGVSSGKSQRLETKMARSETGLSGRSWMIGTDSSAVTQLFEYESGRGIISNKLRKDSRVFLLGADVWADVESELTEVFSAGASIILKRIGKAYGAAAARRLKGNVSSMSVLRQMASAAGWGRFFVRLDEENGSWIRVDVKDCVFCDGKKEQSSEDGCYLLAGMIQGMAEEFYDREYTIIRKKCYVSDAPEFTHTCEIVLQQAFRGCPEETSKKLDWVPVNENFR
jgi:predicted hydrocarbon binding protein